MDDKQRWDEAHKNPPPNWREIWSSRHKLTRKDTEKQARSFIEKHKHKFGKPLLIDIHPKDGFVVYHD